MNHLQLNQTSCKGSLLCKKKPSLISQLDWAICTESAVKYVQSFNILHCKVLPIDHTALSLKISGFERSSSHLLDSAKQLDSYIVNKPNENRLIKQPISFNSVNWTILIDNLPPTDNLWHLTIDSELNMMCDYLVGTIVYIKQQDEPQLLLVHQPPDTHKKLMTDGITFFTTRMINSFRNLLIGRAV